MSEDQDKKPAAEEQNMETGEPQREEVTAAGEPSPEEQLASAHAQLLAAQQQMHDAQQRLQAAMELVQAKKHEDGEAAQEAKGDSHVAPQGLLQQPAPEAPQEAQAFHSLKKEEEPQPPQEEEAEKAEAEPKGYGALNGIFAALSAMGPFTLLLLLALMAWPIFLQPSMATYCPAELKPLTAGLHAMSANSWTAPMALGADGAFNLPQWPIFVWCLGLLSLVPQLANMDLVIPLTTFGSTFLAVFGVWALALAAGFGGIAATAAGVILLCAPLFAPLPHFVGPAALAAGLMLLALACFCKGWRAERAWIYIPLGFIFTTLAGLCGGLLHFAVPLLASIFFLIWRGTFKRAQRLDALSGFIIMLAMIGAWLGVIMLEDSNTQYLNVLFAQAWQFDWPVSLLWLKPIAAGLLGLLPWLLIIFGVAWFKVLANAPKTLGASRKTNGSALIWISLTLALIISIFVPAFHASAVAICCLAAVLLGKAFVNLGRGGNRFFFLLGGLLVLLAGALILALTFPQGQSLVAQNLPCYKDLPSVAIELVSLPAMKIIAGILIAGGLLAFIFVRRFMACGGLVYAAVVVIALCLTGRLVVVPQIEAMPNSPLITYATVEERVIAAMKSKAAAPAVEPAQTAPAETKPAEAASAPAETPAPAGPQEGAAAPQPTTAESAPTPAEAPAAAQEAPKPAEAAPAEAAPAEAKPTETAPEKAPEAEKEAR